MVVRAGEMHFLMSWASHTDTYPQVSPLSNFLMHIQLNSTPACEDCRPTLRQVQVEAELSGQVVPVYTLLPA